jgi:hypothetical protein
MFLKSLEKLAASNGLTPERVLRDVCEKRRLSCGQLAKDLRCARKEVLFWADAFNVATVDYLPKIVRAARGKKMSLRSYFLKYFGKGVGWMAEDLGVAYTTVEEYYAIFRDGETWRIEHLP